MSNFNLANDVVSFFAPLAEAWQQAINALRSLATDENSKFHFYFLSRADKNDMDSFDASFITPIPMSLEEAYEAALESQRKEREERGYSSAESFGHLSEVGIYLPEINKVIILPSIYWNKRLHKIAHEMEANHFCHEWHDWSAAEFEKFQREAGQDKDSGNYKWCHIYLKDLS